MHDWLWHAPWENVYVFLKYLFSKACEATSVHYKTSPTIEKRQEERVLKWHWRHFTKPALVLNTVYLGSKNSFVCTWIVQRDFSTIRKRERVIRVHAAVVRETKVCHTLWRQFLKESLHQSKLHGYLPRLSYNREKLSPGMKMDICLTSPSTLHPTRKRTYK